MTIQQIADKTIPAAKGKKFFVKRGKTKDIVAEVLAAYRDSRHQLQHFAPHLKAATLQDTLRNVWTFWKRNIRYRVDPKGEQWVREPAALWAAKVGDCKSLSVAVMATLNSLGIKAAFRFTAYNGNSEFPTHVYVVVKDKGVTIPVDCVWKEFGTEKPYTKNWDYNMTSIYRLSGFDEATVSGKKVSIARQRVKACKCRLPKRGQLLLPQGEVTEEIAGLLLKKQGMELEQDILLRKKGISGISSSENMAYEIQITGIHNSLASVMKWPRKRILSVSQPVSPGSHHAICGTDANGVVITDGGREMMAAEAAAAQAAADQIEGFFGRIFKGIGKGIKSVGRTIGKGAKAVGKGVAKAVKAPVKLIGKGVKAVGRFAGKLLTAPARKAIQNDLPGYGPFFLYTFITDPRVLAKLPPAVKVKRDKALYYKNLITGKLQLSPANFDQAVRNGIMMQMQATPEDVLATWMRDTGFQIGFLGAIFGAAAGLLGKGLKAIVGDTGENIATDAENFAPAIEDWGTVKEPVRNEMATIVQQSAPQPMTTPQLYEQLNTGTYNPVPQYTAPAPAPAPVMQPQVQPQADNWVPDHLRADDPEPGSELAETKTLPPVTVRSKPTQAAAGTGGSNTGLLLGAGLAFGLLMMANKGKRR